MTTEIKFTQYLRPNGRQKEIAIERPIAIAEKASALNRAGYHFDIEVLMTGQVSMTVEHSDEDRLDEEGCIAHEICTNGPGLENVVDRLVETAYQALEGREKET